MSEPTRIKGAIELKKACASLLKPSELALLDSTETYRTEIAKNLSSPIIIERNGKLLTVAKRSSADPVSKIDFEFTFRLSFVDEKTEWWPVFFNDSSGRTIEAEIKMGDRVLTNVQKQNELIELANTWAKSIGSQNLTRTIDGII